MKHLTYLALPIMVLFLCILIMGFPSHAQIADSTALPSDDQGTTVADTTPIEIIKIGFNRFAVNRMHLLMRGESSASLDLPQLDETIHFYREGQDFAEKDVRYFVKYETEAFDSAYSNQTGLFFLKVSIILDDERYVMASEASSEVSIPIFLYDPDQPSYLPPLDPDLNNYDAMKAFHIVTDVYTDLGQVNAMLNSDFPYQRFYIYFEEGYYLNLPNIWDLNSVKTGIPGVYPAYRRPELPQGVLTENILEDVYSINIQDPEVFTLSSPRSFGNNIVVTWLYHTPEQSLFQLRYRIGDGDWIVDTNEYFMSLRSDENGKFSLFLNPWEMEGDIRYQFQLEYDGVYSDILNLCITEDGFYVPNEGDEDGGDRDNQTPPDVIQPTQNTSEPEEETSASKTEPDNRSDEESVSAISDQTSKNVAPSTQNPSVATGTESDTSTGTTWSGRRIQQYLKASPGLPLIFEKDLIRVALPADSPALLALSDTDFLSVEIHSLSADTTRLAASLNEVPITGIPMTVTMPWTGDDDPKSLQVKESSGEWIGMIDEVNTEGSITFTVTQSGVYTILSSAQEELASEELVSKELTSEEDGTENTMPDLKTEAASRPSVANVLCAMGVLLILILSSICVIAFLHYKRKKV